MTDYSKITALYSRLSVGDEDRDGGESNSIPRASPQAPPIIAPRNISISVIYPPSIPQNLIPNKNTTKEIRKRFSAFPIHKEGTAKISVNPKNPQKHC